MLHSLFKLFSLKYIWNSIPNYLHISRSTFGTCTSQIPFWTAAVPLLCPAMVGSRNSLFLSRTHHFGGFVCFYSAFLEVCGITTPTNKPYWELCSYQHRCHSYPSDINLPTFASCLKKPNPWSMSSCPATRQERDDTFSQIPAVREVS